MSVKMPPWLEELSDDWPSETSSLPLAKSTKTSTQHSSTKRTRKSGSLNAQKQESGRVALSSRNENAVVFNQANVSLTTGLDSGKQPRSTRYPSQESAINSGTVQQKARNASPPKVNQTAHIPEWKKRLIHGEMAYGEQKDLFSPIGLENIFQQANRAEAQGRRLTTKEYKTHINKSHNYRSPKTGQLLLEDEPKCTFKQRRRSQLSLSDDRLSDVETHSFDSQLEHTNVTLASTRKRRFVSGQTELNEDFSPVFISKHSTVDGKVNYAALDVPQERSEQKVLSASESQEISQPARTEKNGYDKSQVSMLSEDLSMGTPDMQELGDFVTCKRGGYSAENSFHNRPLSPSPNRQPTSKRLATRTSSRLGNVSAENRNLPPSPRTPEGCRDTPKSEKDLSQPLKSPLKLFGNHDTFTNHQLLRRMGQLQEKSDPNSTDDQSEGLSSAEIDSSSRTQQNDSFTTLTVNEHGINKNFAQLRWRHSSIFDYKTYENEQLPDSKCLANIPSERNSERHICTESDRSSYSGNLPLASALSTEHTELPEPKLPGKGNKSDLSDIHGRCADSRIVDSLNNGLSQLYLQKSYKITVCADGKRPQSSPTKSPTPKRRRTLLQMETSNQNSAEMEIRKESKISLVPQNMQEGKSFCSNTTQNADSDMLSQQYLVQPLGSGLRQRRQQESMNSELFFQGPKSELEPISEHGEFLAMPQKPVARDFQRSATDNEHTRSNLQPESRKHSLTTQDYIDEAMKIMNWIRSNRPKSGLGSLEEAEGELLNESLASAASMTLSRPPSREGRTIRWRDPNSHQPQSRVVSHLRKYKEDENENNGLPLLESLNLADPQQGPESPQCGSNTIRITHQSNFSDTKTVEGDAQAPEKLNHWDTQNSENSDKFSSGRTNITEGSRRSENVTTFAPDAVAHLIPKEIAGMTFDKEKGLWVRSQSSPNRKCSDDSDLGTTESDDDPFKKIPDLVVDEREHDNGTSSKRCSHVVNFVRAPHKETLLEGEAILTDESKIEVGKDFQKNDRSDASCESFTSVPLGRSHASPTLSAKSKIKNYADVEHEYSMNEGRTSRQKSLLSDHKNVAFSFPTQFLARVPLLENRRRSWQHFKASTNEEPHNIDLSGTGYGTKKQSAGNLADTKKGEPTDGSAQKIATLRKSAEKRQNFEGTSLPTVNKLRNNHEIAINLASPSRQSGAVISATRSPGIADITFYLSELPEFSVNQIDEREIQEQEDNKGIVCYQKIPSRQFELSTGELVKVLQDVKPEEPYWEDIRHLIIDSKELDTLQTLDDFCPRLQALSVARNRLRQLSGAPPNIRQLNATQNQLSALTTWAHLTNLQYLDVSGNEIDSLAGFNELVHLRELRVDNNQITSLDGIFGLDALIKLSVRANRLDELDFTESDL